MRNYITTFSFLLFFLFSFSVFSQDEILEEFMPLPKGVQKIIGVEFTIQEKDTIAENFSEYNFDEKGNLIKWEQFLYHAGEDRTYDSLDRITEINGVYGESFANGTINYYYPSENQKIEIHDTMGFYKSVESEFSFDDSNRIVKEIKYDSTSLKMTEGGSTVKSITTLLYDESGNLKKESYFEGFMDKKIYEVDKLYEKEKLISQNVHCYEYSLCIDTGIKIFYLKEGAFKGKKHKEISWSVNKSDTIKSEIQYSYQKLDSITISQEEKIFYRNQLVEHNKYFYKNNQLVKVEEYTTPKNRTEPKLSSWMEYSYIFYSENKDK